MEQDKKEVGAWVVDALRAAITESGGSIPAVTLCRVAGRVGGEEAWIVVSMSIELNAREAPTAVRMDPQPEGFGVRMTFAAAYSACCQHKLLGTHVSIEYPPAHGVLSARHIADIVAALAARAWGRADAAADEAGAQCLGGAVADVAPRGWDLITS